MDGEGGGGGGGLGSYERTSPMSVDVLLSDLIHSFDVKAHEGIRADKIRQHLPHLPGFLPHSIGQPISKQALSRGGPPYLDKLVFIPKQELVGSRAAQDHHGITVQGSLEHQGLMLLHSLLHKSFWLSIPTFSKKIESFSKNRPSQAPWRKAEALRSVVVSTSASKDDNDESGEEEE